MASRITRWLTGFVLPIPNINFVILIISSSVVFIRSFRKCALLKSISINYINSSGPDILGN